MESALHARHAAFRGHKPRITWELGSRCSDGSGRCRSAWDGDWCMTSLTSTPGSTSIRVEGGP